jgi:predicted enzyme related to lactoylglutathione lyase
MTLHIKTILLLVLIFLGMGCIAQKEMKKEAGMRIVLTSIFVDDPIKAHSFYTDILGFQSKEYAPDAQLAVVVSVEDPNGTALLLEPRGDSFAKEYQEHLYNAGLPVIVFGVDDLSGEIEKLKNKGVKFRDDLTKKEWGLENLFEDSFGNLIMLQKLQ